MSKIDRIKFWILLLLSLIGSLYIHKQYPLIEYNFSDLVTFLSILTGFQITAFSLLFYSKIVSNLYKINDIDNPSKTLKHSLKNYYSFSLNLSILSIIFLLLIPDILFTVCIKKLFVIPIVLANTFMFYKTNNFLYKIFIKETTNEK